MRLSKKIFIFSASALVLVVFFGGIYFLLFKQEGQPKNPTEDISEKIKDSVLDNIPLAQPPVEETISAVSNEAVHSPILSPDGQTIKYYAKTTGKVFELDILSGKNKIVSDTNLPNLLGVLWSPDTNKVLSEFSGATRSNFSFYDYTQKKSSALNANIDAAAWQNNNKIIYKYFDSNTKKGSLNIADPDGSNWAKITDISTANLSITPIPMSGLVSFWNKADAFTETQLQSTSILSGEKKDLIKGIFGADFLWSPDGKMILESNVDKKGGSRMNLGIANNLGKEYKSLGIPTLISKCAWSRNNKFVYYALPTSVPDGAVMPNDYVNNKFNTSDTFWKINIETGEKTRLVELDKIKAAYDASSLFLNADESLLFFINKLDEKLYKIIL